MVIDCDDCAVRGPGCRDCVVSVLLGVPETLLHDERAALEVLAEVGLAPRLRLVPIRGTAGPGSHNGPERQNAWTARECRLDNILMTEIFPFS